MSSDLSAPQTYLSFKLDDEVFAINVSSVLNILEMKPVTKVPKSPEYLKGIINLRGTVLPVVDFRTKFGLPESKISIDTKIIVLSIKLDAEPFMVGIIVDSVCEVLEFKHEEILPPPTIGTKYNSGFITGMRRLDEDFMMILDIKKIFSTDEIIDVKETFSEPEVA
jgi:purine-binding chemotaxis protein CheW